MNISYLLYQAERPLTAAQQREADITAGQLAAAIGRAGHSLRHAVAGGADTKRALWRQAGSRATGTAGQCAVPRPREAQ
ncbi:MAG TPA: hypothetical protein VMI73_19430 [Trebonia sp.]|nr:hypothetical protein [Trebonia sp.]